MGHDIIQKIISWPRSLGIDYLQSQIKAPLAKVDFFVVGGIKFIEIWNYLMEAGASGLLGSV